MVQFFPLKFIIYIVNLYSHNFMKKHSQQSHRKYPKERKTQLISLSKKKKKPNQKFINTNYCVNRSPSTAHACLNRVHCCNKRRKCPHLSFDSSWRLDSVTPKGFLFVKPIQFLATLWKKKMDRNLAN